MLSGKQLAIIDCQAAGISGDMFLGALLDLGADVTKVLEAVKSIGNYVREYKNIEITVKDVMRREVQAKKVDVKAEEVNEMSGPKLIDAIEKCVEKLKLSERAKRFASNSINTLVQAEAKIHGKTVNEVHLHEAALVDTSAEIVGAAVALEDLNLFDAKIYSTPVAVGGGLFTFSHGTVSSPAPATVEILRSREFPMIGGPVESELATPTGVSLLVNLAHEVTRLYPLMKPFGVGYGAGTKDFAEMPNVLRIAVGEALGYGLLRDEVAVLETNLDDVTGETVGHTIDRLLREDAKDVSAIPMFTKKNRPGYVLKVIADKKDAERLSRILMEETGTLGIRLYPCERRILNREVVSVEIEIANVKELVKVKVAKDRKGEIVQMKPEYDEVQRLANKTGKPLREIEELVKMEARKVLLKE